MTRRMSSLGMALSYITLSGSPVRLEARPFCTFCILLSLKSLSISISASRVNLNEYAS